jgi:uncharacterized metal-binding protein
MFAAMVVITVRCARQVFTGNRYYDYACLRISSVARIPNRSTHLQVVSLCCRFRSEKRNSLRITEEKLASAIHPFGCKNDNNDHGTDCALDIYLCWSREWLLSRSSPLP